MLFHSVLSLSKRLLEAAVSNLAKATSHLFTSFIGIRKRWAPLTFYWKEKTAFVKTSIHLRLGQ